VFDIQAINPKIKKIYPNNKGVLEKQLKRYKRLDEWFSTEFEEKVRHYFSVPGRTEIGGNHTDHNHGRVLAASVDIDSIAVVSRVANSQITLYSEGYNDVFKIDINDLVKRPEQEGTTSALIRGVAAGLKEKGWQIGGFNACISSDVLPGSGLSSSASIEVLIGIIFSALYNDNEIPTEELAKTGQYAENTYFGKPCGLMDQMACAVGGIIAIDFEDPKQPHVRKVNFDFDKQKYRMLVVDTGGNHADLTADYAAIPREMNAVAHVFGKDVLREISASDIERTAKNIREKVGDRAFLRAHHFMNENKRVLNQIKALEENRFDDFIKQVNESGNSSFKWLQNVYTSSNVSEQGVAVALAITENFISTKGKGACRVHGGGFAGTILAILPETDIADYIRDIEKVFNNGSVTVLSIRPYGAVYLNEL
jgi:galactokinase